MPTNHEAQERYSKLVLEKVRSELVLGDGFVFNNDYEGSPTSGAVKIPVRDEEVAVSDYDKANGISPTHGSTGYTTLLIDKDKAINEVIDGFDASAVPDNLVADRLDSGGYSLARQLDTDGGNTLLAGATVMNVDTLTKETIYTAIVMVRTAMSKANIPNDGRRYLLMTPDTFALALTCPEFIAASELGDEVKQTGAVGKIAGFLVKEWNDSTANLAMLAGHPKFATRAMEWQTPVHVQDLNGSGNYIGACAVQGRNVYGHKVLRSIAIRAVYSPAHLTIDLNAGSTAGTTIATVSAGNTGTENEVRNCCCELSEQVYSFVISSLSDDEDDAKLSSEKIGNYSITYRSDAEIFASFLHGSTAGFEDVEKSIVSRYLGRTGLLYRGVYE